jgi:hypothetical protein
MAKLTTKLIAGRKQTHGGYSFLATGKLPEHRRYIERYLTGAREALIRDLGPTEQDLTAAQVILIDRTISKIGILRCIEEHIREKGIMSGKLLAPSLRTSYLAYSNSLRLDLQALGINQKRGDSVLTPLELAKRIDEEKEAKEKEVKDVEGWEGRKVKEEEAKAGEQASESKAEEEGKNG